MIQSTMSFTSEKPRNKRVVFDEDVEENDTTVDSSPSNVQQLESAIPQLRNKALIQFDSNLKDHDKFQKITKSNTNKPFNKGKMDLVQQSLPEVSSERYYQTTEALDIGKGSEFSLRTLFQESNLAVEPEEESANLPQKLFTQKEPKLLFKPETVSNVEHQSYWKNAGMWTEPLFFLAGDSRLKEVADFIHQPAKEEAYRDRNKWFEQREKLKQYYRNKMRRNAMWVAGTAQQPQKKRPLVDGTDESSFQYFGQQDEIERQKKKKPHRTFFK